MSTQEDDCSAPASPIAAGIDAITDAVSGVSIPAPIKRNAFKAFNRLCTAAIEIPATYLEGIAAEKRAETAARVKIIETNATQIAHKMEVAPEYARAAVRKFGEKILREQVNLDSVSEKAAREIKNEKENSQSETIGEIDDDWLAQFEKEACQRSAEDMQRIFGRILAGEIRRPSTFSIKSLKILGELDQTTAALFKRLCSLCVTFKTPDSIHVIDARVPSLGGNASQNALSKYGLSYSQLNVLQEYGLIIAEYNSWMDYRMCLANSQKEVPLPFMHQNMKWGLVSANGHNSSSELKITGVALTKAATELHAIMEIDPIKEYTSDLMAYFEKQQFKMVQVL